MPRAPLGKKYQVHPVGEVYLWLYTEQAVTRLRERIVEMNAGERNIHSIEPADLTLLFKTGVPVMQPNPRRRKDAVLYRVLWQPLGVEVRNFYPSDYDSRFYNWLYHLIGSKAVDVKAGDVEALKDRSSWAPMVDNATHPTVEHPIVVAEVDDPEYDAEAHQSSRD
jgi:hypothetical protein